MPLPVMFGDQLLKESRRDLRHPASIRPQVRSPDTRGLLSPRLAGDESSTLAEGLATFGQTTWRGKNTGGFELLNGLAPRRMQLPNHWPWETAWTTLLDHTSGAPPPAATP